MLDSTRLLEQTLSQMFAQFSTYRARQDAEADVWAAECWDVLAAAGLPWVGVATASGGSGGELTDACTLVQVAGRHAVPLPVAECAMLGGWLIADAGLAVPDGPVSVAAMNAGNEVLIRDGRVRGTLSRVPWGARVTKVVTVADTSDGARVALLDPKAAEIRQGRNVAGEPRDTLTWHDMPIDQADVASSVFAQQHTLLLRGALSRALLCVGALETVAEMTQRYAGGRQQFGRPIGSFQAVAHRLVRVACETEASVLAVNVASLRLTQAGADADFDVAVAKVASARAASEVIAHAHQIHGAIGMTQEYPLHHFTRRLECWRQEWGSERHWARVAGKSVLAAGATQLWPRITTGLR
jgi:acyl-CoA dehydrogenase